MEHGKANAYVQWVKQAVSYLPAEGHGKTVLDFGCGAGYPSKLLHERGYKVVGFDVLPEVLDVARAHVPGVEFVDDLPWTTWDYVLAHEVIEHMDDPGPLVEVVNNQCRNFAILTAPAPGLDAFAVQQYELTDIYRLFKPSVMECIINAGEHRLFKITPVQVSATAKKATKRFNDSVKETDEDSDTRQSA